MLKCVTVRWPLSGALNVLAGAVRKCAIILGVAGSVNSHLSSSQRACKIVLFVTVTLIALLFRKHLFGFGYLLHTKSFICSFNDVFRFFNGLENYFKKLFSQLSSVFRSILRDAKHKAPT